MAVATEQKPGEPGGPADFEGPADALVAFGITGDLAKVMTFHSLYRLEARGLLNCPIIGVAGNDWSLDELRSHARSAIENTGERVDPDVFGRLADRLSYVQGDFSDPGTFSRVAEAIAQARTPVFYLEIPPFLFATVIKGLSEAGLTRPVTQTEVRLVFHRPPRLGFLPTTGRRPPVESQLVIKLDPMTGIRLIIDAHRADQGGPREITLDMEFAQEGGEGPTPYEVLLHAAMQGNSAPFTRQDSVEETWRIMRPLIEHPPPVHSYAPGSWGPEEADRLLAGTGRWLGPWLAS